MTLENDIHRVLESYGSLRPSEIITILQEMPQYKSKAEVDWFKVNVSKALRHLKDENIVKESLTKGKHAYRINTLTEKGRKLAPQAAISNIVELPLDISMKIDYPGAFTPSMDRSKLKNRSDFKVLEILDRVQPKGNAFMDVALWFNKPKVGQSKLSASVQEKLQKSIADSVSLFGGAFINPLKQANIDAKNARYHWEGFDSGPLLTQKIIEQEKAALDFEAVMVIRFNGKKIVTEIDWTQEIEKVKEMDKKATKEYQKFKEAISKPGSEQHKWIFDKTKERIQKIECKEVKGDSELKVAGGLKFFLHNQFWGNGEEISKKPWDFLDSPSKLKKVFIDNLVTDLTSTIAYDPAMLDDPAIEEEYEKKISSRELREEIEADTTQTLEDMLKDGTVEIVPVYLFKFKDKQKTREE